ncbi:hypothetical protein ACFVAJ_16995 [Agromyces sp. NPDC057679]|uniref:hypothetical protein n=1 Tax=Agromyces sp. NPDC057679 TaxID=3346207 RepID=UPI00366AE2ED
MPTRSIPEPGAPIVVIRHGESYMEHGTVEVVDLDWLVDPDTYPGAGVRFIEELMILRRVPQAVAEVRAAEAMLELRFPAVAANREVYERHVLTIGECERPCPACLEIERAS